MLSRVKVLHSLLGGDDPRRVVRNARSPLLAGTYALLTVLHATWAFKHASEGNAWFALAAGSTATVWMMLIVQQFAIVRVLNTQRESPAQRSSAAPGSIEQR
jgi:hypothetical protein